MCVCFNYVSFALCMCLHTVYKLATLRICIPPSNTHTHSHENSARNGVVSHEDVSGAHCESLTHHLFKLLSLG